VLQQGGNIATSSRFLIFCEGRNQDQEFSLESLLVHHLPQLWEKEKTYLEKTMRKSLIPEGKYLSLISHLEQSPHYSIEDFSAIGVACQILSNTILQAFQRFWSSKSISSS